MMVLITCGTILVVRCLFCWVVRWITSPLGLGLSHASYRSRNPARVQRVAVAVVQCGFSTLREWVIFTRHSGSYNRTIATRLEAHWQIATLHTKLNLLTPEARYAGQTSWQDGQTVFVYPAVPNNCIIRSVQVLVHIAAIWNSLTNLNHTYLLALTRRLSHTDNPFKDVTTSI